MVRPKERTSLIYERIETVLTCQKDADHQWEDSVEVSHVYHSGNILINAFIDTVPTFWAMPFTAIQVRRTCPNRWLFLLVSFACATDEVGECLLIVRTLPLALPRRRHELGVRRLSGSYRSKISGMNIVGGLTMERERTSQELSIK